MFTALIENAAKFLVVESIRDESLGDLWESNYLLRQRGTPKILRLVAVIWTFLLLVKASVVLELERLLTDVLKNLKISSSDDENVDVDQPIDLTAEIIDQISRYCSIRKFYNSSLTRKLMKHFDERNAYWIRKADRIIEKCHARGDRIIDCEAIVNSFILSNLIRKVESIHPQKVNIELLNDLVKGVNLTEDFLSRYIEFDNRSYKRQLIFQTWSLTVYIISWKPGQECWLHHHGYALDAIKVIRGEMTHWRVPLDDFDENVPFESFSYSRRYEGPSNTFTAGNIVLVGRREAHQIANLSHENLVTLHFRFGHPPEDDHWRSTNDAEMFVWNQTEGCFDLVRHL